MSEEWNGHPFLDIFLHHKKNMIFPKLMAFPNTQLAAIPLHSQFNNYLNQLLEELNDWVHKTKCVVEIFMGPLIDIWLNTFGPRV